MSYAGRALIGMSVAMMFSSPATRAQGVVMQRNLSLSMAKTIAEATLAECKSKGFNTAAAVVDRAGQVLVILRDEQATAQQRRWPGARLIQLACSASRRWNSRSARRAIP